jgi:thiosulfate dehydrogenase [quinone] large subunit
MNSTVISTAATDGAHAKFGVALFRARPGKAVAITFALLLRLLYAIFFLGAAVNKFQRDYMFSDYPLKVFTKRLAEIDPASFGAKYLGDIIIPNYHFFGWFITWGELLAGVGLLVGLMTRWSAFLAFWICLNIALGGFYDASLIPLAAIALLYVFVPSGHWLGLDRRLLARYPGSIWFR